MINKIEVENFRSIQHCKVDLSPLTVIVGANSTGKSNLIKAIDFISDIAQYGLLDAIYNRGGFDEILPKQYKDLKGKEIKLNLEFKINPPKKWPTEYGNLIAEYSITVKKLRGNNIKISQEKLSLNSVFLLAYHLEHNSNISSSKNKEKEELNEETLLTYKDSSICFYRNSRDKFKYQTNFELNSDNLRLLLNWIGLRGIFSEDINIKKVDTLIDNIIGNIRNHQEQTSLLSTDRHLINFSQHLNKLVKDMKSISRYDLFINELRQEQSISNTNKVSTSGDNIPNVVKKFVKDNKIAWNRIIDTMCNISPYFTKVYSETLRAGKEYLVFEEIFDGRPIESWEASDGTLRALAILLCLESHDEGSTILIEEPEHGLHPWAVKDLMQHIRGTIEQKNIQVILTTHSQQVLECLKPNELLITERDETGTHYNKIKDIVRQENITMGEIGSLWTKGLLNGVPKSI
ncbi:Predicted ATPase [Flavobacterium swingsii]|uniref:Predicted ATPase n=1 Tax=Flavobacterium swingsii TaxID=498292 RepID=A0A1I0YUF8_9FLAO|nr:AAA family ATPase [Flavobacterium swingsii]SFB15928.1 Predicted ATPase [Flavobacterium swingsii]